MRIGIVGGALQGMEAVYLAKRAGFETLVMDRRKDAPALSLCDIPVVENPLVNYDAAYNVLKTCDAVIPACEEIDLLECLVRMFSDSDVPLMFDMHSYHTSCSKTLSNRMMDEAGIPLPGKWPDCGFPVIVKPSGQSGSVGVSVAFNEADMKAGLETVRSLGDEPVIQEFVHGKSVSVEVIGDGKNQVPYVTTEVVLDSNYDCKMVVCGPGILSPEDDALFREYGKKAAEKMGLRGLMDVEAIATPKGLRVLEIDARIPSQTPAAIEAATGINLLAELVSAFVGRKVGKTNPAPGASVYRHVVFENGVLRSSGEKVFGKVKSPRIEEGLFGTDRMITDYSEGSGCWRGTMIVSAPTVAEAVKKADASIGMMMDACGVDSFADGTPEVV